MLNKPFKVIATAIAKSPNLEANIFESMRVTSKLGDKLILIHVGKRTDEDERSFNDIIKSSDVQLGNVELVWVEGEPASVILEIAKAKQVDLIIAGAVPREGLLRYYMGSVARRLVRGADCSILLLTHPNKLQSTCGKVVVNGLDHPKTADTIKVAASVATRLGSRELTIVEEVDPSKIGTKVDDDLSLKKANRAKQNIEKNEEKRIQGILKEIESELSLKVGQKCIFGKKGYTISHFTESQCADLLVMNSPDTKLGFLDRMFTHDLEYILSELPSDLLIVHSKLNQN
ncbi:universal stress protein [Owenweeksia hongkongensis]|uniref:universal stress protein n=1 Tax=Owenweeksia hongkongensis TaxID=253245 RepID=UPI003A8FF917